MSYETKQKAGELLKTLDEAHGLLLSITMEEGLSQEERDAIRKLNDTLTEAEHYTLDLKSGIFRTK